MPLEARPPSCPPRSGSKVSRRTPSPPLPCVGPRTLVLILMLDAVADPSYDLHGNARDDRARRRRLPPSHQSLSRKLIPREAPSTARRLHRVGRSRSHRHGSGTCRRYWPEVDEAKLVPDYSGIRTKLRGPDSPHVKAGGGSGAADFAIQTSQTHGVTGLVNLMGIESPGLTASLAIADHVAELVDQECT